MGKKAGKAPATRTPCYGISLFACTLFFSSFLSACSALEPRVDSQKSMVQLLAERAKGAVIECLEYDDEFHCMRAIRAAENLSLAAKKLANTSCSLDADWLKIQLSNGLSETDMKKLRKDILDTSSGLEKSCSASIK